MQLTKVHLTEYCWINPLKIELVTSNLPRHGYPPKCRRALIEVAAESFKVILEELQRSTESLKRSLLVGNSTNLSLGDNFIGERSWWNMANNSHLQIAQSQRCSGQSIWPKWDILYVEKNRPVEHAWRKSGKMLELMELAISYLRKKTQVATDWRLLLRFTFSRTITLNTQPATKWFRLKNINVWESFRPRSSWRVLAKLENVSTLMIPIQSDWLSANTEVSKYAKLIETWTKSTISHIPEFPSTSQLCSTFYYSFT